MIDRSVVHGSSDDSDDSSDDSAEDSDDSSDQDRLPTTRQWVVVYVCCSAKSRAVGKLPRNVT